MDWTEEKTEQVKARFHEGWSMANIAEAVGVTRNAVIGKLHRLGLGRFTRSQTPAPEGAPKRRRTNSLLVAVGESEERVTATIGRHSNGSRPGGNLKGIAAALKAKGASIEAEPELIDISLGRGCTILELTESSCRWPIGEPGNPEFRYCGGDALTGGPYCLGHARIAYQPARPR